MELVDGLIESLKSFEEIEGIMLGGSRASGNYDEKSDYDFYVYINKPIPLEKRRELLDHYCVYMEYGNTFWELEDDGVLNDGVDIEFIYRNIDDVDTMLENTVFKHQTGSCYTTCFWDNMIKSKIVFDRNGKLKAVQDKYQVDYPKELKENIIVNNFKLLYDYMPSFYYQVEKACRRGDVNSINHRTSEFLATYFDIIFALNEETHPGEKRLIELTSKLSKLPDNHEYILRHMFTVMFHDHDEFLKLLRDLTTNLYTLITEEGYNVSFQSYLRNEED
jgi:predicted nucleotidyltransferase